MPNTPQIWFQAYCEQRRGELRQSSRRVYGAWWSRFCAFALRLDTALPDVTAAQAERFLLEYAPNTAIRYYRLLSAVYETAQEHGWCSGNPLASLRAQFDREEDKVPTPAASESTVDALYSIKPSANWKKHRDRMLVILAAETGLRRAELLTLRTDQLRLDAVPPWLGQDSTTSIRRVDVPARTATELRSWLELRERVGVKGILVFPTDLAGAALNPATAYRIIEKGLDQVGAGKKALGASGTQVLRAGLAYRGQAHGQALPDIQGQLGHRRLLSTADLLARVAPQHEE